MTEMTNFDLTGPLPGVGTTMLEASAGTGKTFTIGALVTRYIVEDVADLENMLIVTFGRAATQELRDRVWRQLAQAEQALQDPAAVDADGVRVCEGNALLEWLVDVDDAERARRLTRVRQSLARFDAATIATIHQFCHQVLRGLGVAGDMDPRATLVQDLEPVLIEVVNDLYVRQYARSETADFGYTEALTIARAAAVHAPDAYLLPDDAEQGSIAERRRAFAEAVRREFIHRKRRLGVLSYDDLLSQLADALADPTTGAVVRARMQQRWGVVLVDEFQDTDPVQWQVFERAFAGTARMVLIGDPKQAIYAFRGGDVATYLRAAETSAHRMTLGTNFRADAPLVDALQQLLGGAALGAEQIVVHPVQARQGDPRLLGAPQSAPVRLRAVTRKSRGLQGTAAAKVADTRTYVAKDAAHDIARLLASGATFGNRTLGAGDVAVLAHRGVDLERMQGELADLSIPAVMQASGSVFQTPAATAWCTLLEGIEQPQRAARVRSAALTPFVGKTTAELDAGGDRVTDEVAELLRSWGDIYRRRGIAAVVEAARGQGLAARVLREVNGSRMLTDLLHVGEVLHEAARNERLNLLATLGWLRTHMSDEAKAKERTRRLDTDAAAVQLVTIHGSKGLQYPVVYAPFLDNRWAGKVQSQSVLRYHRPGPDGAPQRVLHVGGPGDRSEAEQAHQAEEAQESLRLLYVALTRAQSQVVTWWSPNTNAAPSPLHRMLFGRRPGQAQVPDLVPLVGDDEAGPLLRAWERHGAISLEFAVPGEPVEVPLPDAPTALSVRVWDREIDTDWRRTSYSALIRGASDFVDRVTTEPEVEPREDEQDLRSVEQPAPASDRRDPRPPTPSPMQTLPVGAAFGSLVHGVLEHADPEVSDFATELRSAIGEQLIRWPADVSIDDLAAALEAVVASPLGPLTGPITLADVVKSDRFEEMEFELPLGGGDRRAVPSSSLLGDIAQLLRRHLPEGDAVRAWADVLDHDQQLASQALRGYLTGSLDLVFRAGGKYFVADYKTNWLGGSIDEQRTDAEDYGPAALSEAMGHSDYPLQALLYGVVLHRYLRWRLPDYDPAAHFGGVLYLYVRGMVGPETPVLDGHPCGVFSWLPPVALLDDLSALLDGSPGSVEQRALASDRRDHRKPPAGGHA